MNYYIRSKTRYNCPLAFIFPSGTKKLPRGLIFKQVFEPTGKINALLVLAPRHIPSGLKVYALLLFKDCPLRYIHLNNSIAVPSTIVPWMACGVIGVTGATAACPVVRASRNAPGTATTLRQVTTIF
jgi:hypothetical protein